MDTSFLLSTNLWIGLSVFFVLATIGLGIFYFILFRKTHVSVELKAFFSGTPIGIFFQDNKFAEWKPIAPINGVVYDKSYGPFIVSTTYVDKPGFCTIIMLRSFLLKAYNNDVSPSK